MHYSSKGDINIVFSTPNNNSCLTSHFWMQFFSGQHLLRTQRIQYITLSSQVRGLDDNYAVLHTPYIPSEKEILECQTMYVLNFKFLNMP